MSKNSEAGPPANSFTGARKTGWLHKHGGSGVSSHWRKRWFVADQQYLFYYKGSNDKKPVGILWLPDYDSCYKADGKESKKQHSFVIDRDNNTVSDSIKKYLLYADSEKEMEEWVKAITEEIKAGFGAARPSGPPGRGRADKVDPKAFDELSSLASEGPKLSHLTTSRPKMVKRRPPQRKYSSYNEDDTETPPPSPLVRQKSPSPPPPSLSPLSSKRGRQPSTPLLPKSPATKEDAAGRKKPVPPMKPKPRTAGSNQLLQDEGELPTTSKDNESVKPVKPKPLPPKKPEAAAKGKEGEPRRAPSTGKPPPPPKKPSKETLEPLAREDMPKHDLLECVKGKPLPPEDELRSEGKPLPPGDQSLELRSEDEAEEYEEMHEEHESDEYEAVEQFQPPTEQEMAMAAEERPSRMEFSGTGQMDPGPQKDVLLIDTSKLPDVSASAAKSLAFKKPRPPGKPGARRTTNVATPTSSENKTLDTSDVTEPPSSPIPLPRPIPKPRRKTLSTSDQLSRSNSFTPPPPSPAELSASDQNTSTFDQSSSSTDQNTSVIDQNTDLNTSVINQNTDLNTSVIDQNTDLNTSVIDQGTSADSVFEESKWSQQGAAGDQENLTDADKPLDSADAVVSGPVGKTEEGVAGDTSHEALGNTETETTQDNVFDVPVLPQGERSGNPLGEGKNFFELLDEMLPNEGTVVPAEGRARPTDTPDYDVPPCREPVAMEDSDGDYAVPSKVMSSPLPVEQPENTYDVPPIYDAPSYVSNMYDVPVSSRPSSRGAASSLSVEGAAAGSLRSSTNSEHIMEVFLNTEASEANGRGSASPHDSFSIPAEKLKRDRLGYTRVMKTSTGEKLCVGSDNEDHSEADETCPAESLSVSGTLQQAKEVLRLAKVVREEAEEMRKEAQRELDIAKRERNHVTLLKRNATEILRIAKEKLAACSKPAGVK